MSTRVAVAIGCLVVVRSGLEGAWGAEWGPANGGRPNVILAIADDLGWGEVAFNGTNDVVKTPCLDEMAESGIRFTRFYAATPWCSPTRASVLTGRHPHRYGLVGVSMNLRQEELTVAEALREAGYTTGHFGKWHLARPFSKNINPSLHGFDRWLSTGNNSRRIDPNEYWRDGERAGVIKGSDNQILMDEALGFIREQVKQKRPFLALIWFHTAHWPIGATEEFLALYKDHPELDEGKQMRYADISSMDAEMGRLRRELRELKIADNTLLCFCTDNGMRTRDLREGKLSLYEGGIRVPGLIERPGRVAPWYGRRIT